MTEDLFLRLGGLGLGLFFGIAGMYDLSKFKQGYGIKLGLSWYTMGIVGGMVPPKKASSHDKGNLLFLGIFLLFGALLFLPGSIDLI